MYIYLFIFIYVYKYYSNKTFWIFIVWENISKDVVNMFQSTISVFGDNLVFKEKSVLNELSCKETPY